jgi:Cu2+-exporting ATPase
VIRQNVSWAIIYNLVAVPLAAGGVLAPWMAAIGMSVSSLIVVLNALRLQGAISLQPEGLLPPQSSEVTDEEIT